MLPNLRSFKSAPLQRLKLTLVLLLGSLLLSHSLTAFSQIRFANDQLVYSGSATTVQWGDFDKDGLEDLFIAEGGKHRNGKSVLSWLEAPQTPNGQNTLLNPI